MHLFLTIFLVITLWPTSVVDITVQSPPTEGLDGCSRAKTARARYSEKADALQLKNVNDPLAGQTDVRHYRLDFEVDLDAQTFSGSTTMTVASRIEDLLIFRFWLNSSMAISSVEVDGEEVEWQRLNETTVDVDLNRSYDEDEVFDIEVSYSGTPVPTWFFSSHDGSRVISTLSSPWYASTWWAVKEDNRDKATGEMLITVPSELTVVSNGVLVAIDSIPGDRRRFHWSTEYPTSPYLFAFAATIYNTFSDGFFYDGGSMPVDFFIYPERDTPDNRDGWLLSVDMLSTFEDLFGPYPFVAEKYAIYNFPFGGGMEHQTATGQGGNHAFGENLTAHELAHQWWGDMVTCATWHDIWLNEGFATYSAALWYEHRSGTRDPEALRQYMAQARPDELDGTVYVYDTSDPDRIFSPDLSYRKAAWVLHMLRGVVGDETIFEILEAFREQHEFSTATTGDFRAVAEDVWGRDLEWFFEEWIYGGGAPAYRHAWREHEVNGQRFLEIMLEQNQNGSVFQMPVEIETFENGQNRSYTIWSDARVEHLLIPVSGEVDDVDLDPDDWILSRTNSLGPFVDGPPKIVAVDPAPLSVLRAGQPLSMTVTFHRDVVAAATDFALRRRDGVEFELAVSYVSGSYTATIDSQGPLPGGRYQLIVSDDVVDAEDGIALDGEIDTANGTGVLPSGDGVAGGDTVVDYIVDGTRRPSRRVTPANLGAKKYRAGD